MLRFFIPVLCVSFVGMMCSCSEEIASDALGRDEQEIRELDLEWSKAIHAKDLDKLISLYAADSALYYEKKPTVRGKAEIRETWKDDFTEPGLVFIVEPRSVEISNEGNLAWANGSFSMKMIDAAGESVWDYALVYKKQPDGKWKIMAESANALLHSHYPSGFPERRSPLAPLAPLIGLACFASIVWFLFGMPIVLIVSIWKWYRKGRVSTGFPVSAIMLIAFFVTSFFLWRYIAAHEWNLSLANAFQAAGDTARYGNPVEDTAEDILVALVTLSTLSAAAAAIITGVLRWLWIRARNFVGDEG